MKYTSFENSYRQPTWRLIHQGTWTCCIPTFAKGAHGLVTHSTLSRGSVEGRRMSSFLYIISVAHFVLHHISGSFCELWAISAYVRLYVVQSNSQDLRFHHLWTTARRPLCRICYNVISSLSGIRRPLRRIHYIRIHHLRGLSRYL